MARKYSESKSSGSTILIIDDSPEVLESTRRLLEAEGHRVLTAPSGQAGLEILDQEIVQLILVDYFMPAMTGEEVVRRVREKNSLVQIILVTGYSGEKPARVMMQQLEIQGYHDKSEGAQRLLLWVDSALKTYRLVSAMEKHRTGLRFILEITPELHRMQPLDELLKGLLWQVEGLLGAENSFLATFSGTSTPYPADEERSEGFVALVDSSRLTDRLQIRAGTGRFTAGISTEALEDPERTLLSEALRVGEVVIHEGASIVPLVLGKRMLGVIYLDKRTGGARDRELLEVFSFQAAAAIQNSLLYDMATTDSLTGTYLRGFAVQQLQQTIKRSTRRGEPVSLLMIDLDRFKEVNDHYGHQAGDRALRRVGDLLKEAVRETDVVGRYGGDEFMVILPEAPPGGALTVANRILEKAQGLVIEDGDAIIPIHLSIGVGTLTLEGAEVDVRVSPDTVDHAAEALIASADRALYSAKGSGRAGEQPELAWTTLLDRAAA